MRLRFHRTFLRGKGSLGEGLRKVLRQRQGAFERSCARFAALRAVLAKWCGARRRSKVATPLQSVRFQYVSGARSPRA